MKGSASLALVVFSGLAGAAQAQDPAFDIAPSMTCLAATAGDARRDCAGRAATACMNGSLSGSTTYGRGFCLDAELRWWDGWLNAAYQSLLALEQATDARTAGYGARAPSRALALRDMQRAWIVLRDATCAYEASYWGGGSGAGPATVGCLLQETAAQLVELEQRLEEAKAQ